MHNPTAVFNNYETTHWLIKQQARGLTHAESVLQLPFRGNCFNWVLGHIVANRDVALNVLGEALLLTNEEADIYLRGSDPIRDGETAVLLDRLLDVLDQQQEILRNHLTPENPQWHHILNEEKQLTVGDRIAGLQWHETYHTGQLEILRQLAGKNDGVIT